MGRARCAARCKGAAFGAVAALYESVRVQSWFAGMRMEILVAY